MISEYLNKLQRKGHKRGNTGILRARTNPRAPGCISLRILENKEILGNKEILENKILENKKVLGNKEILENKKIQRDLQRRLPLLSNDGRGDRATAYGKKYWKKYSRKHGKKYRRILPAPEVNSDRGRIGYMLYIHGFIGCVLVVLALIHIPYPAPFAWLPYASAAILAFITLKPDIGLGVSRILAIATTGMMFFFFAAFFLLVPKLPSDWYASQFGWAAVCRILSAFVMIPILSEYSCRLKAECREARAARRTAFFSVPGHIRPESR